MKSILISIRPKWCEKILSGEKTIEVRKSAPKKVPFRAYIYCTKNGEELFVESDKRLAPSKLQKGKVIGEFICDRIMTYDYITIACVKFETNGGFVEEQHRFNAGCCLNAEEMFEYSKGKTLYGWNISDLKIYDKPRELSEFRKPCPYGNMPCGVCEDYSDYSGECRNIVTRPPQSWCYVEEEKWQTN